MNDDATSFVQPLPTRRATIHLGARLARHVCPGDLVILSGELGAGKTFLVRALCRALGLPASVRVTSPTFTLIHEYETSPLVAHADLYRLSDEEDVIQIGLRPMRDSGYVLLVEWGQPFERFLGGDALSVALSLRPRVARLSASGERSRALLGEFAGVT